MKRLIQVLFFSLLAIGTTQAADTGDTRVDIPLVAAQLIKEGDAAITTYHPETGLDTGDAISALYFDLFEESGMEMAVGLRSPQDKLLLESLFGGVIGAASRSQSAETVNLAWQQLRAALQKTAEDWPQSEIGGFWPLVLQAFLILLREGFEAMLVITALITYLRRQGAEDQLPVIYSGVGLALGASLLTAWLMQSVFKIAGGVHQEALEGVTMLIAAIVLFYVSFWLISKSEAARWQAWIEHQINNAISRGSLFTLGFAAFLAVYREGAETVLFYQALAAQAQGQEAALGLGVAIASAALLGLFWIMRSASLRLPLGLFFGVTAGLLYYLAISFAGNGMLELQEAGWVSITPLSWLPRIIWLGLHPTLETFSAQLLLLVPLPFVLIRWAQQRRKTDIEQEALS